MGEDEHPGRFHARVFWFDSNLGWVAARVVLDTNFRKKVFGTVDDDDKKFQDKLKPVLMEYGYRLSVEDFKILMSAVRKLKTMDLDNIKISELDEKFFEHFDLSKDKWVKDIRD